MFKLTTTKGIYAVLKDIAPADLWAWAEARAKHWKVQVRWTFDPAEQDYDTLCAFAALFKAAAAQIHLTFKRRTAIRKLYDTVRVDCFIGDELLPSVEASANEILQGADAVLGEVPSAVDQLAVVSADPQDEPDPSLDEAAPEEPVEAPQTPPAPVKVQAVASKLAALHTVPQELIPVAEEPPADPFDVPPPERRGAYMLAELFKTIDPA